MGVRKPGLFGARLEKQPIVSPLSVATFLLILKLVFLSSHTNVTSKPLCSRGMFFGQLSVLEGENREVWCLLFSTGIL